MAARVNKFYKIIIFVLANLLISSAVYAQSPEKMSYQAVIRDANNNLLNSQNVGIKISILYSTLKSGSIYTEFHSTTTNENGLVNIEIGNGRIINGDFSSIDWGEGSYFIKTEIDPTGGNNYTITSTSQLLSVPYALHAKTAEFVTGGINESDPVFDASIAGGITSTDVRNWDSKLDQEVDGSVTNEIQALSISNDTIYLTNGGFVKLPAATAGFDGQYSSLSGTPTNLSSFINDVGFTTLGFDGKYSSLTGLPTNISAFTNDAGYITQAFDGKYTSLTGTPTKLSSFLNDAGFITKAFDGKYTSLTGTPTKISDFINDAGYITSGFDGKYSSLIGAPTNLSGFVNDAGFISSEVDGSVTNEIQALSISNDTIFLSNGGFVKLPTTASFDGQYSSLTGAPTNISAFTNDANFLTTEIDGSLTNEGSLSVGAGDLNTSIINSNTSGSTGVTLEAGNNISLSETGNKITIAATGTDNQNAGEVGVTAQNGISSNNVQAALEELQSEINAVNTVTAAVTNNGTALATGDQIYDFTVQQISDSLNTLKPVIFEKELTNDENDINIGFILTTNTQVFYNGAEILNSQWTGLGTTIIHLNLNTKQYDIIKIKK